MKTSPRHQAIGNAANLGHLVPSSAAPLPTVGEAFHARVAKGPFRSTFELNLSHADVVERFARPWSEARGVLAAGRLWNPAHCRLTIYAGPRITTSQQSFWQGWSNAVKFGEDVTDVMLSHPEALAPKAGLASNTAPGINRGTWPTLWGHVATLPRWLATTADVVTVGTALAAGGRWAGLW